MDTTAALGRRAALGLAVVAGLVAVSFIDLVLGRELFNVVKPALAADAAVVAAVGIAFVSPRHLLALATLAAAAASIAVSRAVDVATMDYSPVMGLGAWPGIAEFAGLGLLAAWSVRASPAPLAVPSAGALGAALVALVAWRSNGPYPEVLMLMAAGAWAAVVGAGWYLRMLDARQHQQARQARQEERLAIARELHDLVAHHVTGIVVQAQAAKLVAARRPDAAQRALDSIERAGGDALGAMRAMVGALRDEPAAEELAPAATIDDIRAIATESARDQVPVRLAIDDHAAALPGAVTASLHRIAREAVTNARRHAVGATFIDVNVLCRNGVVHLLVTNDGASTGRSAGGFGLRGMAERTAALGGRFSAGPLPHGGWRVAAELPVRT
ncbi:MAG: sensor histidine kinase [Acidimicrobiales bacterium]